MKYFSLFSGIGGFEYGISRSYISSCKRIQQGRMAKNTNMSPFKQSLLGTKPFCIGFSEIDKYAIQIYKTHFPNHKEYGDVTNIKCSDVPDFDLLCGGFPCQSFSIAGKRGGFSDTRGTLFFEIARIAQEKQPRLLLLENVKGLLSHDKGRTFGTILKTLDELGYDLQWQVLNSKNFGVPQNRERVFIIGHLRTTPRPQVFPLRQSNPGDNEGQIKTTVVRTLQGGGHSGGHHSGMTILRTKCKISKTVRSGGTNSPPDSRQNWDSYEIGNRIRRLTPTECERLQGFPDGWTSGISDTQRYKCLGNAVTTNVISAIMEKLLDFPRRIC